VKCALSPAVTAYVAPLTILASSDARNATTGAMSAGSIHGTPSGLPPVTGRVPRLTRRPVVNPN
jgi:hypothetical protein